MAAARNAGLLVPVSRPDQSSFHFVHRWTARAIAELHPDTAQEAHRRAAAFWHWRVDTIPQSGQDNIDQLLEARYHHYAAGQADQAMAAHMDAVIQLQTWGQYGRATELCRETLTWLTPGSPDAAATEGTLGILAQVRGDYDSAEPLYRRALDIRERIGDQAGIATSYAALGILSETAGKLDEAVAYCVSALAIRLRIGTATARDVQPLTGLRRQLGRDRFRAAAVASGLDEESAASLMTMLDQQEEAAGN